MDAASPLLLPRRASRTAIDSTRPHAFFVEQERAESGEVIPVATVFLMNRECPWRCIYCDLWKNTLAETVSEGAIPSQIDFALAQPGMREARQIKLYNAGSFFDPKAIPPEDFPAIAERIRHFERVIVECHPALVGESVICFPDFLRQKSDSAKLEVAMGLEIADDEILAKLNKRMTLEMFARAAMFLREHDIAMRAFVMVKPPFVNSEEQALQSARHSINFAFDCHATAVSLTPARFGTAELEALAQRGDFAPPKLATLETALDYGVGLRRGRVFADLWDLENISDCKYCFPARHARLKEMNLSQTLLPHVSCSSCDQVRQKSQMRAKT